VKIHKKICWLLLSVLRTNRRPDIIIGSGQSPYMLRWYLIPRNRFFNVYLHHILRSDDDRALHDHPWWSFSLILLGVYGEVTGNGVKGFGTGDVIYRSAEYSHRLTVVSGATVWTLFVTGPRARDWGFYCPQGWVSHEKFDKVGCE